MQMISSLTHLNLFSNQKKSEFEIKKRSCCHDTARQHEETKRYKAKDYLCLALTQLSWEGMVAST